MKIIPVSLILLAILVFFNTSLSDEFNQGKLHMPTNNFNDLGKSFDGISLPILTNNCPQINIPMKHHVDVSLSYYYIPINNYDGWRINPGWVMPWIMCRTGKLQGQNPNYWYCDGRNEITGAIVTSVSKTLMNQDGTIGETIEKTFTNVYDENQNFVKTICGDSPEVEAKRGFDKTMSEMDKWFGGG